MRVAVVMNLPTGRGETKSKIRFYVGEFEDIQQNEVSPQCRRDGRVSPFMRRDAETIVYEFKGFRWAELNLDSSVVCGTIRDLRLWDGPTRRRKLIVVVQSVVAFAVKLNIKGDEK